MTTRKLKQRQRTTRIFIEAAAEIINSEGIDALTIRKVADVAAYNSATLYNYFENLEHLKSLTALIFLSEYTKELDSCTKISNNSYELNENIWLLFYRHSYRRPKIYYSIFGTSFNKQHNAHIEEFYTLFPDMLDVQSEEVRGMLVGENLFDRTMYLLKNCANDGYFLEHDLEEIYELLFFVYQGMLNKLLHTDLSISEDEFVEKAQHYIHRIFESFKQK